MGGENGQLENIAFRRNDLPKKRYHKYTQRDFRV